MKVRLDKYLANLGFGSRKEIAKMVKQGLVKVNGQSVLKSDTKLTLGDVVDLFCLKSKTKCKKN